MLAVLFNFMLIHGILSLEVITWLVVLLIITEKLHFMYILLPKILKCVFWRLTVIILNPLTYSLISKTCSV